MPKTDPQSVRPWSLLLIAFLCIDMWIAGWLLNPLAPADLYQADADRLAELKTSLGGGRLYLSPADEYVLKFERFFRFHDFRPIEDWTHLRSVVLPNMNLLEGIASANNFDPMVPARFARWMDELPGLPPEAAVNWQREMAVTVVEELNVTYQTGVRFHPIEGGERYGFNGCSQSVQDEAAAWTAVSKNLRNGKMNCLVVEGADAPTLSNLQTDGFSARIVDETPNKVVFELDTNSAAWFKLADVWYPGWQAKIDGVDTTIYRANYLFRGVWVPAGSRTLEFVYNPTSFHVAAYSSLLAWIIMLIGWIYSRYRLTSV